MHALRTTLGAAPSPPLVHNTAGQSDNAPAAVFDLLTARRLHAPHPSHAARRQRGAIGAIGAIGPSRTPRAAH